MVTTESLTALKEQLPRGAASKIKARLRKKGVEMSLSFIFRVLDPNQPEVCNEEIIMEAIKLRNEYLKHIADINHKILHPHIS